MNAAPARKRPIVPAYLLWAIPVLIILIARLLTGSELAAACVLVPIGAAAPVRDALFNMPPLLLAMGALVTLYAAWSGYNAVRAYVRHKDRSASPGIAAFSEILPPALVKYVSAELAMVHLALLRWNTPADVPRGSRAFSYHTYLTPMLIAFLVLQLIELAVVHLLVSLWNETVAWVLLAISVWGVLYIVALLKSFRINPVLLSDAGIRVRAGSIIDQFIPFEAIAAIDPDMSAERLKDKGTLNAAILSHPNVCLTLKRPIARKTFFGKTVHIGAVAVRLDEPAEFLRVLRYRIALQA